jgi:hypothetical protein
VTDRALRLRILLIGLSSVLVLAGLLTGVTEGVLMLLPALLLAAVLGSGRYIGEEAIARVRRVSGPRRHSARRRAPAPAVRRAPDLMAPRGGLLLAASLATRPPPLG